MRHPGRSDGQDPVTIQDVARAAAVSTATVSRVLTGPARVRPGLAARVEAAVASLGYVPNPHARALASLRSGVIGICALRLESHARVIAGIVGRLETAGLCALLGEVDGGGGAFPAAFERQSVEAVVFVGDEPVPDVRARLVDRRTPWVACVSGRAAEGGMVSIAIARAADSVALYLAGLGHRSVALVSSPASGAVERAFLDEMRARALTWGADCIDIDCVAESWPGVAARLRREGVTACVCAGDELAAGVIQALHGLNLRIPEDVSVIGWGDRPTASLLVPALTTVRVPYRALGIAAAEMVVALRERHPVVPIEMAGKLVIRRSAGPRA